MRVVWTSRAKRRKGIGVFVRGNGVKRFHPPGEITNVGPELVSVRWDDGSTGALHPTWIKRERK